MRVVAALVLSIVGVGVGTGLDRVVNHFRRRLSVAVPDSAEPAQPSGPEEGIVLAPERQRTVVMLITGFLFATAGLRFGLEWDLPAYLALFAGLVVIGVVDLAHYIVPNRVVYPTGFAVVVLLGLAAAIGGDGDHLRTAFIGAVSAWAALLVVHLITPRGMGFGDVRLSFLLGLGLGWLSLGHVFVGMFLGIVLGALLGAALMATRVLGRNDHIPFGPFLASGAVIAILVGGPLIRWLGF